MRILAVTAFMAGTITGCQSSASKVENAKDNVQEARDNVVVAQQELDQALNDSIRQFKTEYQERITANEKTIAEFKVKIGRENKQSRVAYEKRLAEMEQQNTDMKRRLNEFNENQKENWVAFRVKFRHDMDQYGKAMHDFWTGKK